MSARKAFMRAGWIGVLCALPILLSPLLIDVLSDGVLDRRSLLNLVLLPIFLASVFGFAGFVGWFRHMDKARRTSAKTSTQSEQNHG
jgi:ABC-type protease/lipase transport system fused ATPase/permease subunit